MKFIVGSLISLALVGCGTVARSTGPMTLGPDTYRVAVRAPMGNVGESQRMALSEAQSFCQTLAKEFMVTATRRIEDVGGGPFEVTFRCLTRGDPDLQRPNLQPAPTSIIKVE